jgi:glycosyltransferase involved in cell wall biosynthesis
VQIPRALPTRLAERIFETRRHRTLWEHDVRHFWWRRSVKEIIREKPTRDDVLVTFGQPMVDHLAGLQIRRTTGVRWIAHFSDPWTDNPFDPDASRWRVAESEVLAAADLAVFTSQETVDLVFAKYPAAWRQKARVLPHAFDASLFPEASPEGRSINVRYIGNLFAGRGPEPLLDALVVLNRRAPESLKDVKFEFIGGVPAGANSDPRLSQLPEGCVVFVPRVSYRESLSLMKSADLLLNIDASATVSVFLPSKLVEYVGAGRPIFGIVPPGTSARVIRDLGGWVADPDKPDEIADELGRALAFARQRQAGVWGNAAVRATYDKAAVAASFERMIEELSKDALATADRRGA